MLQVLFSKLYDWSFQRKLENHIFKVNRRPFQERRAIARAKVFRSVINSTRKRNF